MMTAAPESGEQRLMWRRGVWILVLLCGFIMGSSAGVVRGQVVSRGPYLQKASPTSAVIRWRTDVTSNSRVQYGTEQGNLGSMVDDLAMTTEHEIEVSGLSPETRYYYSVGTSAAVLAGDDAVHYFRTHPTPGTKRPVRVWIIGDSGRANFAASQVRDAYLNYPRSDRTDVWLMLGDNAYITGTDAEYQAAVFDMYPQLLRNTILWSTRGNHDRLHSGSNNDYYEIFTLPTAGEAGGLASGTEAYYAFDFANVHFVCIDSEGTSNLPGDPMEVWLANDLAATTREWIIAFWHHPPYSKGSHDSDSTFDSAGRLVEMRENILPTLEAGGVDLVLCGHSHSYERSFLLDRHYGFSWTLHDSMKIDLGDGDPMGDGAYLKPTPGIGPHEGAVYAVPGSSAQTNGGLLNHPVMVTSLNVLGSMVLDISGNILEAVFIDNTGVERDRFSIIKGMTPTQARGPAIPAMPRLAHSAPNPFASETQFRYSLPATGAVGLTVYDVTGRRIKRIVHGVKGPGNYVALWNGRNDRGRRVSPGVYFTVLEFGGEKRTRKVVLVR